MAFETVETSRQDGLPITLMLIEYGEADNAFFAYTDVDRTVEWAGKTYIPVPFGNSKIESSGSLDKSTLEIEISPNASIVSLFRDEPPSQPLRMSLLQGHFGDGDYKTVWTGRLVALNHKTQGVQLSAQPISTTMRNPGLRRHYQYGCPWVLYGKECRANKATATVLATPTEIGSNFFRLPEGWNGAFAHEKFLQGFTQWSDFRSGVVQIRTIMAFGDDLNQVVVNGTIFGLAAATEISLVLGCSHQMDDCENLHGNILNFGGQPWIPTENPTRLSNQFY